MNANSLWLPILALWLFDSNQVSAFGPAFGPNCFNLAIRHARPVHKILATEFPLSLSRLNANFRLARKNLRLEAGDAQNSGKEPDKMDFSGNVAQGFDAQCTNFTVLSPEERVIVLMDALASTSKDRDEEKQRRELAERERDQEKQGRELAEGKRWVTIGDLGSKNLEFGLCKLTPSDWLMQLSPRDGFIPWQLSSVSRDAPAQYFATDIFGRKKQSDHQLAHCIPHSRNNSKNWDPLIKAMMKWNATLFELLKEGFAKTKGGNRVPHSGFIFQPFNYVCMSKQDIWFDNRPSIIFMPIMQCDLVVNGKWAGQPYDCICVADNANVFKDIGAVDGFQVGDEAPILECSSPSRRSGRCHQP